VLRGDRSGRSQTLPTRAHDSRYHFVSTPRHGQAPAPSQTFDDVGPNQHGAPRVTTPRIASQARATHGNVQVQAHRALTASISSLASDHRCDGRRWTFRVRNYLQTLSISSPGSIGSKLELRRKAKGQTTTLVLDRGACASRYRLLRMKALNQQQPGRSSSEEKAAAKPGGTSADVDALPCGLSGVPARAEPWTTHIPTSTANSSSLQRTN